MKKLAFVSFALGLCVKNKETLEQPEMEGLQQILEDVHLESKEAAHAKLER